MTPQARLHDVAARAVAATWGELTEQPVAWERLTPEQRRIAGQMASAAIGCASRARAAGEAATEAQIAAALHFAYFAEAPSAPAWMRSWSLMLPRYQEVFLIMARAVIAGAVQLKAAA